MLHIAGLLAVLNKDILAQIIQKCQIEYINIASLKPNNSNKELHIFHKGFKNMQKKETSTLTIPLLDTLSQMNTSTQPHEGHLPVTTVVTLSTSVVLFSTKANGVINYSPSARLSPST